MTIQEGPHWCIMSADCIYIFRSDTSVCKLICTDDSQ
jgi:hypothetical protein